MTTIDYVICSALIALTLSMGVTWIVTKGRFVKHTRQLSEVEEKALEKRSIVAGTFFVGVAVVIAITMVALNYNIKWLLVTCFVVTLVLCVSFMILTRLIYRRKR